MTFLQNPELAALGGTAYLTNVARCLGGSSGRAANHDRAMVAEKTTRPPRGCWTGACRGGFL